MNAIVRQKVAKSGHKLRKVSKSDDKVVASDVSADDTAEEAVVSHSCAATDVEEVFDTCIDSLDDYFLLNLFSYLTLKEKIAIERVCKRWHTIIRQQVSKQTGLGTTWAQEEDSLCLDANRDHCVTGGDIRQAVVMSNGWLYDFTDDQTIANLENISKRCPNIKCLHMSHSVIDVNCFQVLFRLFPGLECLHLKSNYVKEVPNQTPLEVWQSIGKVLAPAVIHLSIDPHYEYRMKECHLKALIQPLQYLEELRVGTHFDREVVGHFISFLPKRCKVFYSLGRELLLESLGHLMRNQSQSLTHLSFFTNSLRTTEALTKIGHNFKNLVKLKINLSFNEIILTSSSPISELKQLREFSVDLNTFSDSHVDDGLIWCIKDGLPSVKVLEVSRACLSTRAFNAINYCLPQLNKLLLKTIEIQCVCDSIEGRDRTERYNCTACKQRCWQSVANFGQLRELHCLSYYFRSDRPKPFHPELTELLPEFKCLRLLHIFRYDISSVKLLESLNALMKETEADDIFVLKLKSIPMDSSQRVKTPKVRVIRDPFML